MISLPFIEHYLVHRNNEEGFKSRIAIHVDDVYNFSGKAHFMIEYLILMNQSALLSTLHLGLHKYQQFMILSLE